jgi:membrane fusion protein (multidrug efflux system)
VIRFTGRNDVVAYEGGTISSLEVAPGQRVEEGAVLVHMHDSEEAARLRGLEMEHDRKLVAYLQTPAEPSVRQALSQIVSQLESAKATVESRVIRAQHAGTVREVMVRNGQRVDSGTVVMSIVQNGTVEGLSVLAFLPGGERPRLHAHQPLTLTFPGYRGARIHTTVRAISTEVLGANDAKARYLGARVGESVPIAGTVVVVEAILDSPEFSSDGETYKLSDGMIGLAEVQLASHTVLQTMLPGLQ